MPRRKPVMPDDAKDFAVLCFARFMRPGQVIEAIKERYGLVIDRRLIQNYDPTTAKGQQLGRKRKQLFWVTRERFLTQLEEIPIANRAMRLQQLQAHYEKVIDAPSVNVRMALEILEKAAKEAGGVHTNEHHVHHPGKVKIEEVSEDEMRNGIAAAIAEAIDGLRANAPGTTTRQ